MKKPTKIQPQFDGKTAEKLFLQKPNAASQNSRESLPVKKALVGNVQRKEDKGKK